jgi:hypothetical protein
MSYQAGGATSPHNLLDQFRDFLVAAGWTLDYHVGSITSVHKGSKFITMNSFIGGTTTQFGSNGSVHGDGIAIIGHTAAYIDGGAGFWAFQTGVPTLYNQTIPLDCIMFTPTGAIANYWMFADATGDNVVLVAFKAAGVYTYLFFGDVIKPQAWTGLGTFFGASSGMVSSVSDLPGTTQMPPPPGALGNVNKPTALLRADVDSWVNHWVSLTRSAAPGTLSASGKAMVANAHAVGSSEQTQDHIAYNSLRTSAASSRTGGLYTLPIIWLVERDFAGALTGGGWSVAATIPWIFQSQTAGWVPGQQFNISTDPYVVFPGFVVRKFP